jgi:hypothetical protein
MKPRSTSPSRRAAGALAGTVVLVLGALAVSCNDGDSVVKVTIHAGAGLPDVFQLRAALSNAGTSEMLLVYLDQVSLQPMSCPPGSAP